jgi:hypothetical protein
MRVVITVESDDPVLQEIYDYCLSHDIACYPGRYVVVNDQYWIWSIISEPSSSLSYLLIKYSEYLSLVN